MYNINPKVITKTTQRSLNINNENVFIYYLYCFFKESNKERVANLPKDVELGVVGARIQTEAGFKAHVAFLTPDCTSSLYMYQI